jgi:hypothetical protein
MDRDVEDKHPLEFKWLSCLSLDVQEKRHDIRIYVVTYQIHRSWIAGNQPKIEYYLHPSRRPTSSLCWQEVGVEIVDFVPLQDVFFFAKWTTLFDTQKYLAITKRYQLCFGTHLPREIVSLVFEFWEDEMCVYCKKKKGAVETRTSWPYPEACSCVTGVQCILKCATDEAYQDALDFGKQIKWLHLNEL